MELTRREQEILDCLMDGLTYKQTAEKLCIELTTVTTHRCSIFRKKRVKTLQQLLVNEYQRLLSRDGLAQEFKKIKKHAYQHMAEEILKKIKEVTNE